MIKKSKKYIIRYMDRKTTLIGKITHILNNGKEIHYSCIHIIKGREIWKDQKDLWFTTDSLNENSNYEYLSDEEGFFYEI